MKHAFAALQFAKYIAMSAQDLCNFAKRVRLVGHNEFCVALLNFFFYIYLKIEGLWRATTLKQLRLQSGPGSNSSLRYPQLIFWSRSQYWPVMQAMDLTCCACAVFKAPCLDVSSAGMGRLHASSILGSILLLFCRLPGCRLHNWA